MGYTLCKGLSTVTTNNQLESGKISQIGVIFNSVMSVKHYHHELNRKINKELKLGFK